MVKVFGFARDLESAFELLNLMLVFNIKPSIIIFTNLIHISFYCRDPRKAELAFSLFRK
jgi:pentatricopeptide repeat protein